jgi:hypothetical protein
MDRILSARVDEVVIKRIDHLARQMGMTKKAVIERAILELATRLDAENEVDLLVLTSGAWARRESSEKTVTRARKAFREGMERHHR